MMKNVKMILLAGALFFVGQSSRVMAAVPSVGAEAEQEICPICHVSSSGAGVVYHLVNTDHSDGCFKNFHKACINKSLKFKKACPTCRGKVTAKCFVSDDAAREDSDSESLEDFQISNRSAGTGHAMGLAPHAGSAMAAVGGGYGTGHGQMSEQEMLDLAMAQSMSEVQMHDPEIEAALAASLRAASPLEFDGYSDEEAFSGAGAGQGMGLGVYNGARVGTGTGAGAAMPLSNYENIFQGLTHGNTISFKDCFNRLDSEKDVNFYREKFRQQIENRLANILNSARMGHQAGIEQEIADEVALNQRLLADLNRAASDQLANIGSTGASAVGYRHSSASPALEEEDSEEIKAAIAASLVPSKVEDQRGKVFRTIFSKLGTSLDVLGRAEDMQEGYEGNPELLKMLEDAKNNRLREISETDKASGGAGAGAGTGMGMGLAGAPGSFAGVRSNLPPLPASPVSSGENEGLGQATAQAVAAPLPVLLLSSEALREARVKRLGKKPGEE